MGGASARMLVAEGAKVVIGDILDERARPLAARSSGDAARYVHLDVTQAEEWEAAVAPPSTSSASSTSLVNNAGIFDGGQIGQFDYKPKWQQMLDVNLTGTFLGMQAVADAMNAAGGGSIINTSSIEGLRGTPGRTGTSRRSGACAA